MAIHHVPILFDRGLFHMDGKGPQLDTFEALLDRVSKKQKTTSAENIGLIDALIKSFEEAQGSMRSGSQSV